MSVVNDVRVRFRANIIIDELHDQGDAHIRPGKNGTQGKHVIDLPAIQMSAAEFKTRLADAQLVIQYGYRVTASSIPPIAETSDPTNITTTTAKLNGFAISGGGSAFTGFNVGTTRALGTTVMADEGVTGGVVVIPTARSYAWAGLTPNTKYYYRFFVSEIGLVLTQYGIVKSFTTKAV